MNKINEKMDCQTRLCKSAVSGDWTSADLAQKSKTEPHHSPRAGAKIFARRIGSTPQIAHIQKSGVQSYARPPRSFEAVAQAGRSMIEMLGVLAIIGVLTIGGLMGYRYAMNKHKANTILNDVSLAMADLTVQDPDGGAIARQAVAFNPESGLAMESERTEDGNNIVYVNGVAKAVCQILIQIKPTDAYENIYDGDLNALTSCNDNQTMAFGSKDSGEPPVTPECQNDSDCAADEICQNGHCVVKPIPTDPCEDVECFNGGKCNEGSCDCIDGYTGTNCEIEPDCNDSKPCTSPKQCENYICVCPMIGAANTCQTVQKINGCDQLVNKTNTACGTNGFCSNGACRECTLPKVVNAAKDGCECPKIENCKEYNDSTCECNKCEDGYRVTSDGKCEEIPPCADDEQSCTSGSDQWCCPKQVKMDDVTCGTTVGDCCMGSECCTLPKNWIAAGISDAPICCSVGEAAGREDIMSWKCCDVKKAEVLVSSTGSIRNDNYCCPKGSIVYDALSAKCLTTCPENATTDVIEGNQMGQSVCYCNEGFTWNSETGGCDKVNTCADGQVSVTNYDSAGNNIGEVCCEVKEDFYQYYAGLEKSWERKNYVVVGALNGSCCGGYTTQLDPDDNYYNLTYKILVNGGSAYCASEGIEGHPDPSSEHKYVTAGKFCVYYLKENGEVSYYRCSCATSGNPSSGSTCDL